MRRDEFDAFVDAELARLHGYARVLTGNDHDAWDLTQETLVRIGLRWRRVRKDGNPAAYARTTMVRLNVDRFRRGGREHLVAAPPDRGISDDVAHGLDPWLAEALTTLSPHQRTVVVLRFVDDLDLAGIAAAMGCSVGTVKSHLFRARRRMLFAIEQSGAPNPSEVLR